MANDESSTDPLDAAMDAMSQRNIEASERLSPDGAYALVVFNVDYDGDVTIKNVVSGFATRDAASAEGRRLGKEGHIGVADGWGVASVDDKTDDGGIRLGDQEWCSCGQHMLTVDGPPFKVGDTEVHTHESCDFKGDTMTIILDPDGEIEDVSADDASDERRKRLMGRLRDLAFGKPFTGDFTGRPELGIVLVSQDTLRDVLAELNTTASDSAREDA